MSTPTSKSQYLFLIRGEDWTQGLSPEEIQRTLGRFMGWFEQLKEKGIVKAGQPLEDEGRVVSGKNGRMVADGPFAESKEAVGGYFLLEANSLDEAVAIAQGAPILDFGASIEVRPIAQECPTVRRAIERGEVAVA